MHVSMQHLSNDASCPDNENIIILYIDVLIYVCLTSFFEHLDIHYAMWVFIHLVSPDISSVYPWKVIAAEVKTQLRTATKIQQQQLYLKMLNDIKYLNNLLSLLESDDHVDFYVTSCKIYVFV